MQLAPIRPTRTWKPTLSMLAPKSLPAPKMAIGAKNERVDEGHPHIRKSPLWGCHGVDLNTELGRLFLSWWSHSPDKGPEVPIHLMFFIVYVSRSPPCQTRGLAQSDGIRWGGQGPESHEARNQGAGGREQGPGSREARSQGASGAGSREQRAQF